MVSKKGMFYSCEECHLLYREKRWAEKCQAWCKEHNSCNLAITRHSERNLP